MSEKHLLKYAEGFARGFPKAIWLLAAKKFGEARAEAEWYAKDKNRDWTILFDERVVEKIYNFLFTEKGGIPYKALYATSNTIPMFVGKFVKNLKGIDANTRKILYKTLDNFTYIAVADIRKAREILALDPKERFNWKKCNELGALKFK